MDYKYLPLPVKTGGGFCFVGGVNPQYAADLKHASNVSTGNICPLAYPGPPAGPPPTHLSLPPLGAAGGPLGRAGAYHLPGERARSLDTETGHRDGDQGTRRRKGWGLMTGVKTTVKTWPLGTAGKRQNLPPLGIRRCPGPPRANCVSGWRCCSGGVPVRRRP